MTDVTDAFERASLGGNWTQSPSFLNLTITGSSDVTTSGGDGTDSAAFWNANTFTNDQYSQVTVTTVGAAFGDESGGGPLVRHQSGASTYYMFFVSGGGTGIVFEATAGATSVLGATYSGLAVAAGTTYRLTATGTTLTPRVNAGDLATRTDASITTGAPGIHAYDGTAHPAPQFEDWLGGPIVAATTDRAGSAAGTSAASAVGTPISLLIPDADITDGGWLTDTGGSSLFAAIDETPASDTDYIVSSDTDTDTCEIRLSDPGTTVARPFSVAYRYKRIGTDTPTLRVQLMEGATSRASWDVAVSNSTFTDGEQFLTAPEFASIVDFTDLRVRFTAIRESSLTLEGDFSGGLTLEGDFSGSLLLEGS